MSTKELINKQRRLAGLVSAQGLIARYNEALIRLVESDQYDLSGLTEVRLIPNKDTITVHGMRSGLGSFTYSTEVPVEVSPPSEPAKDEGSTSDQSNTNEPPQDVPPTQDAPSEGPFTDPAE